MLYLYATQTLGMLALENIIEVLPWRPQIEQLDEVMSHVTFWLHIISSKDWGIISSSTLTYQSFKNVKPELKYFVFKYL